MSMSLNPLADVRGKAPTVVNFVRFVARDGLSLEQPYGSDLQLSRKVYRQLQSSLVAPGQDTREAPKPEDEDFKQRTRTYAFAGVERHPHSGVVTAVYLEE